MPDVWEVRVSGPQYLVLLAWLAMGWHTHDHIYYRGFIDRLYAEER
jgi:hypothetical protein